MASRSEAKAQKALQDLHRDNPKLENGSIVLLKLDLADIKSTTAATEEIKKKEARLDILGEN